MPPFLHPNHAYLLLQAFDVFLQASQEEHDELLAMAHEMRCQPTYPSYALQSADDIFPKELVEHACNDQYVSFAVRDAARKYLRGTAAVKEVEELRRELAELKSREERRVELFRDVPRTFPYDPEGYPKGVLRASHQKVSARALSRRQYDIETTLNEGWGRVLVVAASKKTMREWGLRLVPDVWGTSELLSPRQRKSWMLVLGSVTSQYYSEAIVPLSTLHPEDRLLGVSKAVKTKRKQR